VYIIFNGCAAIFFYWLARVPKKGGSREKKNSKKNAKGETNKTVAETEKSQGQVANGGEREGSGDDVSEKS